MRHSTVIAGIIILFGSSLASEATAAWPAGCYVTAAGDYICNNYTPPSPPPSSPPPPTPPPPSGPPPACGATPDPLNINPSSGGGNWYGNWDYGHAYDMGYTWGYHAIRNTSCLGFPALIIDQVTNPNYAGGWIRKTLDPLATPQVDLRYVYAAQTALIFRFRTPPADHYVWLDHGQLNINPITPYTSAGLSKQPCDTANNLLGAPLAVAGPGGTSAHGMFTTKAACPMCQNTYGHQTTLEPNQIYYYTILNANPVGATDDGVIDTGDRNQLYIKTGPSAAPSCP